MSFENLLSILKNYIKNGYKNTIVTDLRDSRVREIPNIFKDDYVIISLFLEDDKELTRRVAEHDSGFKNASAAIEWNEKIKKLPVLRNEYKIDNTHNSPEKTVEKILEIIK